MSTFAIPELWTFQSWLPQRRHALGLTQTQAAERIGIERSNLAAIEKGYRVPSDSMKNRIANALAARPSELLRLNLGAVKQIITNHNFTNLRLFGSCAFGTDAPGSDIDFIVDKTADTKPGLLTLVTLEDNLEQALSVLGFDVIVGNDRLIEKMPHVLTQSIKL